MKRLLWLALPLLLTGCVVDPGWQSAAPQYRPPPPAVIVPSQPSQPPPPPPPVIVVTPTPLSDRDIVFAYEDLLGREPSAREVWDWSERSRTYPTSREDLRHELLESGEFRALSPEIVVRRAFRDYCRTEPRSEEMRFYRRHMIDDHWSVGQVRRAIAEAARTRRGSDRDDDDRDHRGGRDDREGRDGGWRDDRRGPSPDAIVARAYDDLLERKPDPAGRDRYRRMLERGASEEQVRASIRESVEYRVTLPDSKTRRAYQEVLGREPDEAGLQHYRKYIVDRRWTEDDVKEDLRRSAEYRNRKK